MPRSYRNLYIVAGILSLVIYGLGIATGVYFQESVLSLVEKDIGLIKKDLEDAQQENILLSLRGKESCPILSSLSSEIDNKLGTLVNELIRLENQGEKGVKFEDLKKEYGSLSIRAWILRSSINENCGEGMLPVLYYYSVPCENCMKQGEIIDEMKDEGYFEKAVVYVLDKNIVHPLVQTLVKSHNVTQAPSLVIGDEIYPRLMDKRNLTDVICARTNATICREKRVL